MERHKKIKKWTKKNPVLLIAILAIVGLVIAQGVTLYHFPTVIYVKSQPMFEDPLEAWSEASYVVWEYNSTWYACRNMSTNLVEYLGPSDDIAIQWGIDNQTAIGGTVYVKAPHSAGTYSATVTLKDKVRLVLSNGAAGITVTIDVGATASLEDFHNFDFKRWDSGVLVGFVEDRSQAEADDYTIFKEGSFYFAKNGTTGSIDYSGTNATQVIQNAIDDLTVDSDPDASAYTGGNGSILLKNADYNLGTFGLNINFADSGYLGARSFSLRGEGEGTALYYTGTSSALAMHFGTSWYYGRISDLSIYGNGTQTGVHTIVSGSMGIFINATGRNVFLDRFQVRYMDVGLYIDNTNTIFCDGVKISSCNTGIKTFKGAMSRPNAIYIRNIMLNHMEGAGIDLYGDSRVINIDGGSIENCSVGIRVQDVETLVIKAIYFELQRDTDIQLGNSSVGTWVYCAEVFNCWFDGVDAIDYAIKVYRVQSLVIDSPWADRYNTAFLWFYSTPDFRTSLIIRNPYYTGTWLLDTDGIPSDTDFRFIGLVQDVNRVGETYGAIVYSLVEGARGTVLVADGNGTYTFTTTENDDCPVVLTYYANASHPAVVAVAGYCQVRCNMTVTVGDTLVTSGTVRKAYVDNTETDPKKIIGWAIETTDDEYVWTRING